MFSIDLGVYFLMLCFALYNTVQFLIIQRKGKIAFLSAFYTLTILVAMLGVTFCAAYLCYHRSGETNMKAFMTVSYSYHLNFYLNVYIALLQSSQMVELAIYTKHSAEKLTAEQA